MAPWTCSIRDLCLSMAHTTTKDHADTPCLGSHLGPRAVQIWPHLSPGAAFRRVSHAPHLSNTVELAVMTNEQVTQPESWPSPSPTAALRRVDLHTSDCAEQWNWPWWQRHGLAGPWYESKNRRADPAASAGCSIGWAVLESSP